MPLSALHDFSAVIRPLHQAIEILAPLHSALRPRRNNFLHLPMFIQADGLSSGLYPGGGSLLLSFRQGALLYTRPSGGTLTLALADHTQESLFDALLAAMKADELAAFFADVDSGSLVEALIHKISGHSDEAAAKIAHLTHNEPLTLDTRLAGEYFDALYTVYTGVARFRAQLEGHMTPIVVWPEHFDLSTLWFVEGDMNDHKAHMNFGFAPYTPGQYERPYFYAYAYPYPEDFKPPALPEPAFWNPTGWKGVVIQYDDIAAQDDPALFIETMCQQIFAVLHGILGV